MKHKTVWFVAAIVAFAAAPLWLAPYFGAPLSDSGKPAFGGADDAAKAAIGQLAPDYAPWFLPLLEPASGEVASLLFALQAAIGAGVIGYWLGGARMRERLAREQAATNRDAGAAGGGPSGELADTAQERAAQNQAAVDPKKPGKLAGAQPAGRSNAPSC